jgi:hypothetical protein
MDLFFSLVHIGFEHGFLGVSVVCHILFIVGRLTQSSQGQHFIISFVLCNYFFLRSCDPKL